MEKVTLYIYNITDDFRVKLTIANAKLPEPDKPVDKQRKLTVRGYEIHDVWKIAHYKAWYRTPRTIIMPERNDDYAFYYFFKILKAEEKKIIDAFIILDTKFELFEKGKAEGVILE